LNEEFGSKFLVQYLLLSTSCLGSFSTFSNYKTSTLSNNIFLFCSIFILLARESGGCAIFWTNPHSLI